MPMYTRSSPADPQVIDRWNGGVGWIAHPEEGGRRASHAVRGDDGVWLFDPIDAPGVDDLIAEVGDVAGVAVLSSFHARDADAFARRHDVYRTRPAVGKPGRRPDRRADNPDRRRCRRVRTARSPTAPPLARSDRVPRGGRDAVRPGSPHVAPDVYRRGEASGDELPQHARAAGSGVRGRRPR